MDQSSLQKEMLKIKQYRQEQQNSQMYGSLIFGDTGMVNRNAWPGPNDNPNADNAQIEQIPFNKYQKVLSGLEFEEDFEEPDYLQVEKSALAQRNKDQKKMIKDHESDSVDLMVLTNQNPYLMAEWLRASAVAHDSSKSFAAVVEAMNSMLTSDPFEITGAAQELKTVVSKYLSSHKKRPLTISGRQRVQMCKGILERVDMFPALIIWQQKFREEREGKNGTNALAKEIADAKSEYASGHKSALNRQKIDDMGFENTRHKEMFANLLKPENKEEKENTTWNDTFFNTAQNLLKAIKEGADDDKLNAAQEARMKVLDSMVDEIDFLEYYETDRMTIDPDYFAENYVKLERIYRITEYFRDLEQNANSPDAFYLELPDKQYFIERMADKAEYISGIMHFNDVMRNIAKQYSMRGEKQNLSDFRDEVNHINALRKNAFKKNYERDIEIEETIIARHLESGIFEQQQTRRFAQRNAEKDDPFAMLANCSITSSSNEMNRVKNALTKIDGLMDRKIPVTEKDFKLEQTKLVAAYNEMITHCDSYLQARAGFRWTENGKLRKLMVQQVKDKCTEELKQFEAASANVFRKVQKGERRQWIDVISQIRTETIDMDVKDRQVKKSGAGTSEVLICRIENENKYFKQTEKFERISSEELAYREMEVAVEGSIEKKIKDYLDNNPGAKDYFSFFAGNIGNLSPDYFPSEIDNESLNRVKTRFSAIMEDGGAFVENICTDIESTKNFIAFALKLGKNDVKCGVCSDAKITDGEILTNRNVATSRVANLLGVPKLIASSKNVDLKYQGKEISGNLMDEAKGESYGDIVSRIKDASSKLKFSSEALKQLYTLLLLDYLCGQVDRNQGNFLCTTEKNKDSIVITGITGIDNDMSFGELELEKLKGEGVVKLPPIISKEGVFNIPAIDEEVGRRLMSLTYEELKYALKDLLGERALNAAAGRLEALKEMMLDAVEKGDTRLISDKDPSNLWEDAHEKRPSRYLKE